MDILSSASRSAMMARIRNKNTAPELLLRRYVWAKGLRYRLNQKVGRCKPDLVFAGVKLAVFVDGCFWHRCPDHCIMPKTNSSFWKKKLERNVNRDLEVTRLLCAMGWTVIRLWEHEVEQCPASCANKIAEAIMEIKNARSSEF